jgi:hypothetical protein
MSVVVMLHVSALSVSVCFRLEHSAPMTLKAKDQSVRLAECKSVWTSRSVSATNQAEKQEQRCGGKQWAAADAAIPPSRDWPWLVMGRESWDSIDECGWGEGVRKEMTLVRRSSAP